MAEEKKNSDNHIRTLEKSLWQEYITMPSVRELDCPDYKTYAMRLKEAGKGKDLEKKWEKHRAIRSVGTKNIIDISNYTELENKAAFLNSTTMNSQMARLRRLVQLGLNVAESDLDKKRSKLKALVLKEETALTHEYVDRAQKLAETILEQKRKKVEEIVKRQEIEREEQVRFHRELQARQNSQDYKNYLSKTMKVESAEVQKQQIRDKMIQKEREAEYNKFWLDLSKKHDDERKKYEEQEAINRWTNIQEQKEILNRQILGKKIMQDEIKKVKEAESTLVDKVKEKMKEEEEIANKFRFQQKMELKKIKLAELEENRKFRMEKAAKEKAFDDYYCQKVAENIKNDKLNKQDKRANLRKEADHFKQQLKELNAVKLEEEKLNEILRQQEVDKKEAIIKKNQEIMREAKEKLQRETLETWKQQILHKKQLLEEEKEVEKVADKWSEIMLGKNVELDKMLKDHHKEEEINCVKDLDSQIKYVDILNQRKIQEDKDFRMKIHKEDQIIKEACKTIKPFSDSVHPFTKRLNK